MKKVTDVFCAKKTGSDCVCGCSCGTCRQWLGRFNTGLAEYYLRELIEDPSKLEAFASTQVGKFYTDKSLAAQIYRKEYGPARTEDAGTREI